MNHKYTISVAGVVLFAAAMALTGQGTEYLLQQQRANQGLKIAPVPLNLDGKDPNLVGYGSYLVNAVGGCNDCHTNPAYLNTGDPYQGMPAKVNAAGYLGGGMTFGPFTSRNLTPEPENGNKPAGMDFDLFVRTIRTGVDPDMKHPQMGPLLEVMPWPTYANMSDYDLYAIYAYLSAIPPVKVPGAQ